MSALARIAHFQNRGDEVPNQELARYLASQKARAGVRQIARNLRNKDKGIQADCIKVLYEVGYIAPALIAEFAEDLVKLLKRKNNRLVWGGMIALGTVADRRPEAVLAHLTEIKKAMDEGSVITMDNGVATLARAASNSAKYNKAVFPYLLKHLKNCRSTEVAQHTEKRLPAVNASSKAHFVRVREKRMADPSCVGRARVKKVIKERKGARTRRPLSTRGPAQQPMPSKNPTRHLPSNSTGLGLERILVFSDAVVEMPITLPPSSASPRRRTSVSMWRTKWKIGLSLIPAPNALAVADRVHRDPLMA